MPVLLSRLYPAFSIYNPATGTYSKFQAGKLVIDEDNASFGVVMAEAARNPDIIIVTNVTQCPECGEQFTGKMANAELGKHRKTIHPLEWDADREAELRTERNVILSTREGFACDVCSPVQSFGSEEDLALHTRMIHGAPFVDADGKGVPVEVRDQLDALPAGG